MTLFKTKKDEPAAPAEETADEAVQASGDLSPETEKAIQSATDRVRTKYVKEREGLTKTIEEKDRRIAELEGLAEKASAERARAELATATATALTKDGIPTELLPLVLAEDRLSTNRRIETLKLVLRDYRRRVAADILGPLGTTPTKTYLPKTFTVEQIKKMSSGEIERNWDTVTASLRRYGIEP